MRLASTAFTANDPIPVKFTCDGDNVSPPLSWSDPPAATRSFAVVCSDPDAPGGVWYHWAIFDIPQDMRSLPEAWPQTRSSLPQAMNDFRRPGYGGPCPPPGAPAHHYHFRLYALNVQRLDLAPRAACRDVEIGARLHSITTTELVGLFGRAPNRR